MTAERPQITLAHIDSKMETLADIESIVPFSVDVRERVAMKAALVESGARIEIDQVVREGLLNTQFRNLTQGRGPSVVAILGEERAQDVLKLVQDLSIDEPRFGEAKTEESRLRGHLQLAADLVSLSVLTDEKDLDRVTKRMNRRLWKGASAMAKGNPEAVSRIDQAFAGTGIEEPDRKVARALPKNVYPLWMVITGREIVEQE